MSVELKEPVLVIGLGGVGSKLAERAKKSLDSECLTISNDNNDFSTENKSIHISTKSIKIGRASCRERVYAPV